MLSDKISKEIAWRKKEITLLKHLIHSGFHEQTVLSRCGVALLYAHWEGFVKNVSQFFLEFIYLQRHRNRELRANFLTLSMKSKIGAIGDGSKFSHFERITDFFSTKLDETAFIPVKTAIDSESNLSSKVLKEIVWCLGLDYSPYESKEKFFDAVLLARRNHIAHGGFMAIDLETYDELHELVMTLMTCFKNQVENSAVSKAYLGT
jgi:hypothetical protein